MSDDKDFGPWIDWAGGPCPIPDAKAGEYDLKFVDGNPSSVVNKIAASMWNWREGDVNIPIIAYRVRIPADDLLRQAIEALRDLEFQLDGTLHCIKWEWDGDQREIAEMVRDKARAVLTAYDKREQS